MPVPFRRLPSPSSAPPRVLTPKAASRLCTAQEPVPPPMQDTVPALPALSCGVAQ